MSMVNSSNLSLPKHKDLTPRGIFNYFEMQYTALFERK